MKINNLTVQIFENEEQKVYDFCSNYLKKDYSVTVEMIDPETGKKKKEHTTETEYFYQIKETEQGNVLEFRKGLLFFVLNQLDSFNYTYKRELQFNPDTICTDLSKLKSTRETLLDEITLKEKQWEAITAVVENKGGVLQAGTGFGKTYCLAGIVKMLNELNNRQLTVLLIAPTLKISKQIVASLKKTKAGKVANWKDYKYIAKGKINVACSSSLRNVLKRNPDLLKDVEIFMEDECHHQGAPSNIDIYDHLINTTIFFGVSASYVEQKRLGSLNFSSYYSSELRAIQCMGSVVWDCPAKELIEMNQLCKPVLQVINRQVVEGLPMGRENNWVLIQRNILMSKRRTQLIIDAIEYYLGKGLNVCCLVNNHNWARKIAIGIRCPETVGLLFGSEVCEVVSPKGDKTRVTTQNLYKQFEAGRRKVLICSNFFFEGADVPQISVVMNCISGRNEKRVIQMTGRGLRLHPSKREVVIVDIHDIGNRVLEKQFYKRLEVYRDSIGIESEDILYLPESKLDQKS